MPNPNRMPPIPKQSACRGVGIAEPQALDIRPSESGVTRQDLGSEVIQGQKLSRGFRQRGDIRRLIERIGDSDLPPIIHPD